MSTPILVLHHADADGYAAAWACRQRWSDAECVPVNYGEDAPVEQCRGRRVVIVDFSYLADAMRRIGAVADGVLVLDHHASAEAELAEFTVPERHAYIAITGGGSGWVSPGHVRAVFDRDRAGCTLAWDVLVGGPRPEVLAYVEDRDLWRWKCAHSREVNAALASYSLETLGEILDHGRTDWLLDEGRAILRYQAQIIEDIVEHVVVDNGIPNVTCQSKRLTSDVGHRLIEMYPDAPYVAVVRHADGALNVSLRSSPDGADVSEVARFRGGGGHVHAAGYRVKL